MARHSFRWPPTHPTLPNVLKAHGYTDANTPGDIIQVEADDFALEPGKWSWDGAHWVPFTPPPPPPSPLTQALDALLVNPAPTTQQIVAVLRVWRQGLS